MTNYIHDGVDLRTPLRLEPGKRGKFEVVVGELPAGKSVTVSSLRNAIYAGLKTHSIVPDAPMRVHKLLADGDVATSDIPLELFSQSVAFRRCRGHVLVGGLGIGMATTLISRLPRVKSVRTVEIEKDVVDLVWSQLPRGARPSTVMTYDLFKYIPTAALAGLKFNSAYFDIWSPTGESAWDRYVVPLRRLMAQHYPKAPVYCWLEEEMLGQVSQALQQIANVPGGLAEQINKLGRDAASRNGVPPQEYDRSRLQWVRDFRPYSVFWDAFCKLPETDGLKTDPRLFITTFLRFVGTPIWEEYFGQLWTDWKPPRETAAKETA